ncbi:apolipoprotein N-acyltransferase [Ketogulonicigenium robustum]|uniref:Apolipoprotein N-acyltransferase n=1 Tax=Ketogulonicigenium robustum TaxID=92947 RepID=A0A1W6NY01_9RHOB|nr:apolipoprotein N-acyltransferase [Ketogulonicigenium robustum]ARO13897.1 apolipoprotein N-acyltransferase [Ketogulonicigenium robustum]
MARPDFKRALSGALVLVALGAVAGLGIAPFGWWPLTLVAFALFLARPAQGFVRFWLFGIGYFSLTLWWIVEPFLVDIPRTGILAPLGLFAMCGGMALFWGAAGWVAARLRAGALGGGAALALAELARSHVLTGFPWAMPGEIWIDTPLAQLGAFIGPFGLTLVTLGLAVGLAWAGLRWRALAVIGAGAAAWAAMAVVAPPLANPQDGPVVRLVQPNIAQSDKWRPAVVDGLVAHMTALSVAEGQPPDLVVWPESATPWLLEDATGLFADISRQAGAPLLVGAVSLRGEDIFNSLALVSPDAPLQVYDKVHLVPFGEYVPLGETLAHMGITGFAARDGAGFTQGAGPQRLDVPGIGPTQALICYEGIFAPEVRAAVNAAGPRPRFVTIVTNDAWFGRVSGPYQHVVQARMRAIELGLPVVRVGNNGVSAMIDARGRMTASLPLNTTGVVDAVLPPALPATLYAKLGDWPAIIGAFVLFAALALRARRKSD